MFGVGLHFHLKDLLAVRKIAIPGTIFQIAIASALGAVVTRNVRVVMDSRNRLWDGDFGREHRRSHSSAGGQSGSSDAQRPYCHRLAHRRGSLHLEIVIIGKPPAAFMVVMLLRRPLRSALSISVALAQIGEFSQRFAFSRAQPAPPRQRLKPARRGYHSMEYNLPAARCRSPTQPRAPSGIR
jgi:hypothetical protein